MNDFIKKYRFSLLGALLGAAGGYAYYYFIGCASGTCPITSNPYISVIWGALMGYLIFDMFNKKPKEESSGAEDKEKSSKN